MIYLSLFSQLLPLIFAAIRGVEAAIPATGQGAAKHEAVMTAVSGLALDAPTALAAGLDVAQAAKVGDVPGMSQAIGQMITTTVKLFNDVGAFQKSGFVQGVTAAQDAASR